MLIGRHTWWLTEHGVLVLICKPLTMKTTLSYSNKTFNIRIGLKWDLVLRMLGKTSAKSEVLVFEWEKQRRNKKKCEGRKDSFVTIALFTYVLILLSFKIYENPIISLK